MVNIILTSALVFLGTINSEVVKYLSIGDAKTLALHFNSNIDLTIQNDEGLYSKIQAEQILKKFFASHPVVKYSTVHVGNSKDGSYFEIGKLQTKAGTYRSYFLIKGEGANQKIHQFRIEDDNE